MTLDTNISKTIFHGNGVATTFPFAFKVWSADQLTVTVTMPGATEQTEEDVTAQCSISLTESGGSVVYLREGSPLPAGAVLSITRDMPFVQEVDLVSASRFDPQVIEDALDQAAAERQQLREGLSRAVKLSATSATTPEDMVEDIFDARDQAEQSATGAAASATAAADSATTAADSADLSRRWASEDVDVPVQAGEYSAKHYAHKAKDAVPDNLVSRVEAVEGKTQSATTSTRGIGRVATAADMVAGATIDNGPAFLSVGSVVTPTPTANAVPQAGEDGTLDEGWIDYWDMYPPYSPLPVWKATLGGSDGRRAIMPGEEQVREEWILCDGGSDGKGGVVPDLRGRYIRGVSTSEPEGTTGGSEDFTGELSGTAAATTLNTSQMPSHTHPFRFTPSNSSGTAGMVLIPGGSPSNNGSVQTNASAVSATGGNGSHTHPLSGSISGTHTDPHIAMNYFIKVV